jgi:hypothetical protein
MVENPRAGFLGQGAAGGPCRSPLISTVQMTALTLAVQRQFFIGWCISMTVLSNCKADETMVKDLPQPRLGESQLQRSSHTPSYSHKYIL